MEFKHLSSSPLSCDAAVLVIPVYGAAESDALAKAVDGLLGGALLEQAKAESFKGKEGQSLLCYTRGAMPCKAVALVGGGDHKATSAEVLRHIGAFAVKAGKRISAESIGLVLPPHTAKQLEATVQLVAEGAILGDYSFLKHRTGEAAKPSKLATIMVYSERIVAKKKAGAGAARAIKTALSRAEAIGLATCHARDMVNEPGANMTPQIIADIARAVAKKHTSVTCKVFGPKECEKLGMGMFLAVGQGSDEEVRLVHLTYKPKRAAEKKIAFIGKGVTFDSGGYSLKPAAAMDNMKMDMAGSAAVISALDAIATLGSPYEIHVIAACAENMVSARAYKVGDILKAMDGTTVEINNTDAEGRLTLGDAITYAKQKCEPDEIINFATLTGACIVALGDDIAGVMGNDEALAKRWMHAVDTAGEQAWRLPLPAKLAEGLKSSVADLKNSGPRAGGTMTAGLFLKHFVKDTPWVHMDIAGPAFTLRGHGATAKGGTGYAVASIVEYATRG